MKILLSLLLVLFGYNLALACSCIAPDERTRSEAIKTSPVIFQGKVMSIAKSRDGDSVNVRFRVQRTWKGVRTKEIVITTPRSSAACGYSFERNKIYTIYASGKSPSTNLCLMLQINEKLLRETLGGGRPPALAKKG
jgi:hypothetical protein